MSDKSKRCVLFMTFRPSQRTLFMARRNWVPLALSDLDNIRMKHGGLLNKHFCKKKSNNPNDSAEIVNFHFSHYKSMETVSCHSNQNSYPTRIKKT